MLPWGLNWFEPPVASGPTGGKFVGWTASGPHDQLTIEFYCIRMHSIRSCPVDWIANSVHKLFDSVWLWNQFFKPFKSATASGQFDHFERASSRLSEAPHQLKGSSESKADRHIATIRTPDSGDRIDADPNLNFREQTLSSSEFWFGTLESKV